MPASFGELLHILWPFVPEILVKKELHPVFEKMASRLSPIYRGGFEFRLEGNNQQVDIHQRIAISRGEHRRFARHLTNDKELNTKHGWRCISDFARQWSLPSSPLEKSIHALWLEFDIDNRHGQLPVPRLFFRLATDDRDQKKSPALLESIFTAIKKLLGAAPNENIRKNFPALFRNLAGKGQITHVGLQPGNPYSPLRINLSGLSPNSLSAFLNRCNGPPLSTTFIHYYEELLPRVDQVIVSLEINKRMGSGIGLEFFISRNPDQDPRWKFLMDELVARGLCTAEKRNAFLQWPGQIRPADSLMDWPEHLIAASMTRPPNEFSMIYRKLSHIKLQFSAEEPVAAKGYFGAFHQWTRIQRTSTGEKGD